jgi:orotate phosphoribosyltransferase
VSNPEWSRAESSRAESSRAESSRAERSGDGPAAEVTLAEAVAACREILRAKAVTEHDPPIRLASGQLSRYFVDGKAGLALAADLSLACRTLHRMLTEAGIDYDAVGGPTLGADHLAVGMALAGGRSWYFVRKEP